MNDSISQFDNRFLILGDMSKIQDYTNEKKLKKIIKKEQKGKLPGIWGTLGWKDNQPFNFDVQNSEEGNTDESTRDISTVEVIDHIKSFNTEIKDVKNEVVERYINFDSTNFNIDWEKVKKYDDIPELRLDLFVDDSEGAMVYYYHQRIKNLKKLNDISNFEEFIQCKKTDDNFTTKRDRLTYFFKVLPPYKFTSDNSEDITWTRDKRITSFIIKIITFKRKAETPKNLLEEFFKPENLVMTVKSKGGNLTYPLFGKKKYGLLIYDSSVKISNVASSDNDRFNMRGAFLKVDSSHKIDYSKKTLLLIHGTFSCTLNTYMDLVRYRNGTSELEEFLKLSGYEQVLAFNHPTISADVFDNVKQLKKLLGSQEFEKGVSLLAASRGCLLAQAIGADKNLPFKVDRALMLSPANGVAYFKLGSKISTGLSMLEKLTKGTPASYAFALLQFSADYFMDQPGAKQMTFGSRRLNKVINGSMASQSSKYFAVINDWEKGLIINRGRRFWMRIADGVVKLILGFQHDFVVGVKGQRNLPPKYNVSEIPMASTHCKYFEKDELCIRNGEPVVLSKFLSDYL
ncbi:MAG: hypothetical protein ABFS16_07880 [Bacteroidota bacterium]